MALQIFMPALSPTMTEGKLARWLKREGDAVKAGDVLAEIETDKATMEYEAVDEGVLAKILVPEGTESVAVNAPIAVLKEEGDGDAEVTALIASNGKASVAPSAAAPSAAAPSAAAPSAAASSVVAPAPPPLAVVAPPGRRTPASPLARRLAKEKGLDMASVSGTGPNGRVVRRDVEKALAHGGADRKEPAVSAAPPQAPHSSPALQPMPWQTTTAIPNDAVRKTIARRLSDSKRNAPHFYLSVDVEIDALLALRKKLNEGGEDDCKLSVNDFIIKASALALRKVPEANAMWTDEAVLRFEAVDVAVAVATPNGLLTPVIRHADQKGLATVSNEMKALAAKARDGKLKPEEFMGGGFTISNLGMYGVKTFSAIVNPPQSCILAVGAGEQRPVVKQGALSVAVVMTTTLSVDHRSVDGATGAKFLTALKALLEEPLRLML